MCVCSPPYWGLRDYGDENKKIWDKGNDCNHDWNVYKKDGTSGGKKSEKVQIKGEENFQIVEDKKQSFCNKCGAWKGQLGLEPTPELYVKHLKMIFAEVKRVLKDDGTLWLNLGDSYVSARGRYSSTPQTVSGKKDRGEPTEGNRPDLKGHDCLKDKDLAGIPWRVAFALQEDGWYLRNDIIWHKPNPMPESVKDRCTTSHEHIFLLSKSKKYYYDIDAIREPHKTDAPNKMRNKSNENYNKSYPGGHFSEGERPEGHPDGKNKRDVWKVNTKPFPEAHFAVYPPELIRPCIKAGCPDDGIVLDPFIGAGTTALVALQEDKNFVGIELNKEYIDIAYKKIGKFDKKYYNELPEEKKPKQRQLF